MELTDLGKIIYNAKDNLLLLLMQVLIDLEV